MTDAWESTNKVDTTYSKSTEKFVVVWDINIKTVFIRWGTSWRTAAFLEFVTIQWICITKHRNQTREWRKGLLFSIY